MKNSVYIKEIFKSVQGEGPYVGYNQLFIRFSKCNLNCSYCDTDFKSNLKEYTAIELANEVKKYTNIHSISLTGGEPLMETPFLAEFLPLTQNKIYLETNGTLHKELEKIIDYIDIISMDIKLNSCSKNGNLYDKHAKFIQTALRYNKEIFVKTVFDENITDTEINTIAELLKGTNISLILQPKTEDEIIKISYKNILNIFNKFNSKYNNVRLIPQVHKFLNIR
ncbi:7-carboxy-7-deazaguanine synthase QueE [bacterium]|nr:7-carboxy-7-deazaguanine synthase QueE [bacterium]